MVTKKSKQQNYEYSFTEKLFMFFSFLLFCAMTYAYFSDFSIRRFLGGKEANSFLNTPIGHVEALRGDVQRQRAKDYEFRDVSTNESLYPNDTIMTGVDSGVTIVIKDGEKFKLSPNSLVKLVFDYDFSSGGVVQKLKIKTLTVSKPKTLIKRNVVLPKVVLRPVKEPPPPPKKEVVIHAVPITPKKNASFSFNTAEYKSGGKNIKIEFSSDHSIPNPKLQVFLKRLNGQSRELGFVVPKMTELNGEAIVKVSEPGEYTWRLQGGETRVSTLIESKFAVDRYIEMIELLPTIGEDNQLEGSATKKEFKGLTIQWRPVEGLGPYKVKVMVPSQKKVVLQKEMSKTRLLLSGTKVQKGKWNYIIQRSLRKGFIARSKVGSFGFEFLAPKLVAPAESKIFDKNSLSKTLDNIFFTWTKTNYTDAYQFELASDPEFRSILTKHRGKDNVKALEAPADGKYYWRVRSISGEIVSPPSKARSLRISRE